MIYYAKFCAGYIGGIAIVSATNPELAAEALNAHLEKSKITDSRVSAGDMVKFDNDNKGNVAILSDGDY